MVATGSPDRKKVKTMGEGTGSPAARDATMGEQQADLELSELVPTKKAYKCMDFLNSPEARMIRIQCELEEPKTRLRKEHVDNIVMYDFNVNYRSLLNQNFTNKFEIQSCQMSEWNSACFYPLFHSLENVKSF